MGRRLFFDSQVFVLVVRMTSLEHPTREAIHGSSNNSARFKRSRSKGRATGAYCAVLPLRTGEYDGIFGPHTLRAVIDYQDDRDAPNYAAYTMPLAVDGVVGIHTWARLDPDPIKNGDTGALVMLLQAILKDYGYLLAVPDGVFGNLTETAVKAFQADYSLPVSGKVGKDEWQKLQS